MPVYRLLPTNASLRTNDGDTSYVSFSQGVPQDFTFDSPIGIIDELDVIDKISVVWVAKDPDVSADVGKAGIKSGGLRQYGVEQIFDFSGYRTFTDDFLVDASDGQPWTILKLVSAAVTALFSLVSGTEPRITFMAVDVTTTAKRGLAGTGEDLSHQSAVAASGELSAAPSSLAPVGTPASLGDSASAAVLGSQKAEPS